VRLLRYGTAKAVAHYAEQALGRGYRHLKLHEITVPEVKAARDVAGPDVPIMLDTNCPWRWPRRSPWLGGWRRWTCTGWRRRRHPDPRLLARLSSG
jgi:hypothetical protein